MGIQDKENKNWIPAGVYPVLDTGQEWHRFWRYFFLFSKR